jgi:hypothetical protein
LILPMLMILYTPLNNQLYCSYCYNDSFMASFRVKK